MKTENKYTPIKCSQTKEPLFLGDKVKDFHNNYGVLAWCSTFNRYIINIVEGGSVVPKNYIKVHELKENNIRSVGTECRRRPLRKKW